MYRYVQYNGSAYREFDGDFTQFLRNIGVSKEHIDAVKSRIVNKYPDGVLDNYHSLALERRLVPTDKILWTGRSTEGLSFYENVRIMKEGDREPSRFNRWLDKASKNLSDTRDIYQKLNNPVKMTYIKNEDKYFLSGDGNHRTLIAIVLGATSILANIDGEYELNHEKLKMYNLEKEFYEKYNIDCIIIHNASVSIGFYDDNSQEIYEVDGFKSLDTNLPFSDILQELEEQIKSDLKKYALIRKLPNRLLKFINSHLICKSRIQKYFLKFPMTNHERINKKYLYLYYWEKNKSTRNGN
ncbi:MAG: hypothetical protein IKW96_06505 [Ruminococcus sp.]|uniref:hypothetical protein n=1 Tax=Ruminococcus sp. TaxID=41978 RepID=UPI0025D9D5BD|nr:hypothetical protein [Ruminococcus sp.]MBR5682914.1 hypothetical protein [Ruminococcus sp.]